MNIWPFVLNINKRLKMKYLFDGLPLKVITYIKIHLRYIYSTGLFDSQEREDLIQDLVLFYLEFIRERGDVPDDTLFMALKSKAMHLGRTRLREMQSGSLNIESLNSMLEAGFEPVSSFSIEDVEQIIAINEAKKCLKQKEQDFIDLLLSGVPVHTARKQVHGSNDIFYRIEKRLKEAKQKNKKF